MSAAHSQIVTTPLASALALAEAGFWVFPLEPIQDEPDRYRPFEKGWQAKATRDPAKIRDWWQAYPSRNIGIFTGKFRDDQALVVIDVDVRDGKPGQESLDTLCDLNDLPATWESRTASGGKHIAYTVGLPVSGAVNWLGTKEDPSGLDLRSSGNFIIAPGSVRRRGRYELVNALEPQPLPTWLNKLCSAPRERASQEPVGELDTPSALARVCDYLRQAPPAIQGSGGDDQTYKVAAQIKDMGVSEYQAQLLMLEHYDPRCVPPWGEDGIAAKVASAYAHGQNAPGSKAVTAEGFSPVPPAPREHGKLYYEFPQEIEADLDQRHLVKFLLPRQSMSVLFGKSNSGKTFVAMDLCYHIATGRPWHDRKCDKGLIVYVAAEAGRSARNRIAALKRKYGDAGKMFALVPCPVDLLHDEADTKPLIALCREIEERVSVPVAMVVIDTLSRALAGGAENASEDMGAFVKNVDRIRAALRCHLMVVHHTGKDESKGARGHSLLLAATDTELEIADGTITVTKQRDMDAGKPIGFDLRVVELGVDQDGDAVTSCTVETRDAGDRPANGQNPFALSPREQILLNALNVAIIKKGSEYETGKFAVSETIWRDFSRKIDQTAFSDPDKLPDSPDSFRKAFVRARDGLVSGLRVKKVGADQWVTS